MKISFFDIMSIAPISGLKTNIHRKTTELIIKNENELRTYGCREGFLSAVRKSVPDINDTDLYEDYCYVSKLLRAIKYNFLEYHQHLISKDLYPNLKLPCTEINIDYITLYDRHKTILKPDDPHAVNKLIDTIYLNKDINGLFSEAIIDVYRQYNPNLTLEEINELIKKEPK